MLNDASPTILGFLDRNRFALLDIRKIDFLKLCFFGINRWPRVRAVELALTGRLVGVTGQLEIERRLNRLAALVHDLVMHANLIGARCQGVSLAEFHTTR